MSLRIITTTEEKYNNLSVKDEHAMYLLDNGMFFINGKMYGNDIKIVESFPTSPIPNVLYINSNTLEKKAWINGAWKDIERIRSIESSDTNGNLKIDGIETQVYKHPDTHAATMITEDETHKFVTNAEKSSWNAKPTSSDVRTLIDDSLSTFTSISEHTHDERYYTESEVDTMLDGKAPLDSPSLTGIPSAPTAPSGTNTTQVATTAFAQTEISAHNTSFTAHSDIRELISDLTARLNALADSDDTTLDQLSEVVAYIKANRTLIESITTSKISVSDIIDSLTSTSTDKPLSANQGKILNDLISALQTAVDAKVDGVKGDAETSYRAGNVNITPTNIGLGNVPNVSTNDQTPTYIEATTLSFLSSGEKLSVAFGKVSKAVTDLISHISDTISHVTSTERILWNTVSDKVDKISGKQLSTNDYTNTDKEKLDGINKTLIDKLGESDDGTLTFNGSEIKTNTDYIVDTLEEAQAAIDAGLIEEGATIYVKEDYVKIVSFADGTDDEIVAMIDAHYNDEINIFDYWSVGDTRSVSLSAMEATGVSESHRAQTVEFAIADFEHDDLTTPINGHTKAAVTLTQVDCLMDAANESSPTNGANDTENGYMNDSDTNSGGWASCARRTWCNNVYLNALPDALKLAVKDVNKLTSAGSESNTIDTTSDKVFLLSEIEIFGSTTYAASGEGEQYTYYQTTSNRYKSPKWSSSVGKSNIWSERSPYCNGSSQFCYVYRNGEGLYGLASNTYGLAPNICI